MNIAFIAPLRASWQRTKEILFRPFELRTWLVVGFTAWLAGLMHSTGGGVSYKTNFRSGGGPGRAIAQATEEITRAWAKIAAHPGMSVLIALGIILAIMIVLLLLWLSSRFKLIFLDNVATGKAQVAEPWRRLGALGDSLFLWRLCFGIAAVVVAVVMIVGTLGLGVLGAAGIPRFIHRGLIFVVLLALAVLAVAVVLAFIGLWVENFIVPIMYRFNLTVLEAWRYFIPWLKSYFGAFAVYGLFVIALAVTFGLAVVAFGLMTCCIGWIIIALPYVGTVILLPMWMTYRLLGPEFLKQFSPEFGLTPGGMDSSH